MIIIRLVDKLITCPVPFPLSVFYHRYLSYDRFTYSLLKLWMKGLLTPLRVKDLLST